MPGRLEFTQDAPSELVTRLEKAGYMQMLLISDPKLTTQFFKAGLVYELWFTVEPKIFGIGANIVNEEQLDIPLRLAEMQKINNQGSMLLKYHVTRPTE